MDYSIAQVRPDDRRGLAQVDALLARAGIRREAHLDYTCALYDDAFRVIATGSCLGNTLRCFAVSGDHRGEGLLNQVVTHLLEVQMQRGNLHLFLYTKVSAAPLFADLGFHEIARVDDTLVFLENRRDGFARYLQKLARSKTGRPSAALVMNANPFTNGHRYLVETAAAAWETVHLFVVSEDASLVPFAVRKQLVQRGVAHLSNVICHDSGPYIISNATFPSYFLQETERVIAGHARLDLAVFIRIAAALGLSCRYVGEEPASRVTSLYNAIMQAELPKAGIECRVVPRLTADGLPVSASTVRAALQRADWATLRKLVPATTYDFFTSAEAAPILEKIRQAGDVRHY